MTGTRATHLQSMIHLASINTPISLFRYRLCHLSLHYRIKAWSNRLLTTRNLRWHPHLIKTFNVTTKLSMPENRELNLSNPNPPNKKLPSSPTASPKASLPLKRAVTLNSWSSPRNPSSSPGKTRDQKDRVRQSRLPNSDENPTNSAQSSLPRHASTSIRNLMPWTCAEDATTRKAARSSRPPVNTPPESCTLVTYAKDAIWSCIGKKVTTNLCCWANPRGNDDEAMFGEKFGDFKQFGPLLLWEIFS